MWLFVQSRSPKIRNCKVPSSQSGYVLALCILWIFSGCNRNKFDVPVLATAEEQFNLASEQYDEYSSPLNQPRRFGDRNSASSKAIMRKRERLYEMTVSSYEQVISTFPNEDRYVRRSRLAIAMIHSDHGKYKEALHDFKELIEDYPSDDVVQIESLFFAARISDLYNKTDDAKQYYQEIMNRFSDHKGEKFRRRVEMSKYLYSKVRVR